MTVETWANGFGIWHARVSENAVAPLLAARRAIRDELTERNADVAREAWVKLVRVPELDTEGTLVYREPDAVNPFYADCAITQHSADGEDDGLTWFHCASHDQMTLNELSCQ